MIAQARSAVTETRSVISLMQQLAGSVSTLSGIEYIARQELTYMQSDPNYTSYAGIISQIYSYMSSAMQPTPVVPSSFNRFLNDADM